MPHPTRRAIIRWAGAAAVLFVVLAYPLSLGPLYYFAVTGDLGQMTFFRLQTTVYRPCMLLVYNNQTYRRYISWWSDQGLEEAARRIIGPLPPANSPAIRE